ncbi:MAG: hypothetical protein LCH95_12840 [Proteobacteria bacterium]|nr:hypothetical protein [Pseudomonadota bacterium]
MSADIEASLVKLADLLIHDAAAKGRSLTYTQLLQKMGWASEFDSGARVTLVSKVLPEIARRCHSAQLPILSVLAVSATTRKPEQWFRIFAEQSGAFPKAVQDEGQWRTYVDGEQKRAVKYWAAASGWPLS